jgi:MYXO-CTERM domain-containing protein
MKALNLLIPVMLVLTLSKTAGAVEMTLQNDGWTDGGAVYCQAGFAAGEAGAATLGPVAATFTIKKIRFLFCGDTLTRTVTLRIYLDSGNPIPGTEIHSADYQVTGSDDALQEMDLSGENVVVPGGGSIRVSLQFQHSGLPSISRDDDGITAGRNWINAQGMGWVASNDMGLTGDWVIRAIVDVQQVDEPDAGVAPDGTAQDADAGGDIGGDTGVDAGGDLVPDEDTTTCNTSADCPGGHICRDNLCVRACSTSSDCLGGEVCQDGVCVPLCTDSSDCQGGQVCENGLCVTVCAQDSDCLGGEVCKDQRCVEAGTGGDGCGCATSNSELGLFLLGLLLLARRRQ